jgi:hypothetical protein
MPLIAQSPVLLIAQSPVLGHGLGRPGQAPDQPARGPTGRLGKNSGMTDSGAGYAIALLAGQVEAARREGEATGTQSGQAARSDLTALVRRAAAHAATGTITSLERLTVGVLLQLAAVGGVQPEALLQAIGRLHADRPLDADRDFAVALLTIRLDLTRRDGAGRPGDSPTGRSGDRPPASWDEVRAGLLADVVAHCAEATISTLAKIATALLVELAAAFGATAEDLLGRLDPYAADHGG